MSLVEFKKSQCPVSVFLKCQFQNSLTLNLRNGPRPGARVMSLIFVPMWRGFMSHVDFKKWSCPPVEYKGQELH